MAMTLAGRTSGRFSLRQNSEINVTPFVDVMLVLLIIFMVAAPMATVSIGMDMPPNNAATPSTRPPTYVSVAEDGRVYVSFGATEVRPSSLERLGADVAASLGGDRPTGQRVMLRAEPHVRYRRLMDVLSRLHADGYAHVGLISEATDRR